jgi:hypothetical protein
MVENIVRHFGLASSAHKSPLKCVRDAAREVELAPLVLHNRKAVYGLLFRASAETLMEVA